MRRCYHGSAGRPFVLRRAQLESFGPSRRHRQQWMPQCGMVSCTMSCSSLWEFGGMIPAVFACVFVALEPHNLMFCFLGVLVGNLVGVLPGMGPVATISILLPLTFGIEPARNMPKWHSGVRLLYATSVS